MPDLHQRLRCVGPYMNILAWRCPYCYYRALFTERPDLDRHIFVRHPLWQTIHPRPIRPASLYRTRKHGRPVPV